MNVTYFWRFLGVNFKDVYVREGDYPDTFPITLGIEGSGVVTECGDEVKDIEVGQPVGYMGIPVNCPLIVFRCSG